MIIFSNSFVVSPVRVYQRKLSAVMTRAALAGFKADALMGLLLFLAGFYAYTYTLAPTVLEGDAALFQYTPYVLGVTYPTGYPLYILLGKLWLTLFPFGEIAWRMNLFSALCSAAALPLIYGAARRLFSPAPALTGDRWTPRWAAVAAVLIFATLPTFWRWSTEAKIYALNILLFSGVLYTLSRVWESSQSAGTAEKGDPRTERNTDGNVFYFAHSHRTWAGGLLKWREWPLAWPVLLVGLQICVHSTTALLLPGLLLFAWFHLRAYLFNPKRFLGYCLLLALPGLLYFYIPLRAEWLIARYGYFEAVGRGLLADFYRSGWQGLVRYFSAADFTGGVVTNWGLVPEQFLTVYLPELLLEELSPVGVGLGLVGGVLLAVSRPRRFLPLFLLYALPIPFVLTYGQGEQSAFLLPSFLIFALFAGYTVIPAGNLLNRLAGSGSAGKLRTGTSFSVSSLLLPLLLIAFLGPFLLLPQIQHNLTWLTRKWTRAIYEEWADALNHPLEPGAGLLAHWGDLTSFWYLQHVEGRRADLRGVYPPDEATVLDWYNRGNRNLYIAGPLQGWTAGIEERYQLIPWGRLVRIAPRQIEPASLLPEPAYPIEATFDGKLRLLGADYPAQAVGGQSYPVRLNWQALEALPPRTTISLRLSQGPGIAAQLDERLRSGWFPSETLPAGQHVLSYALIPVPLGTLPGEYRLELVAYTSASRPWTLPDGTVTLGLGTVEVVSPPADFRADLSEFKPLPGHDFGGEIALAGYDYTVSRVGQGKGFGLKLLWQAQATPAGDYTLRVEALDANDNVLRTVERRPLDGRAPTSGWQPGQFIRDQVNLIVPASAPPGEAALRVRLSWLRPDGSSLTLRRWRLPFGDSLTLDWLAVTEKEKRVFEPPAIAYPLAANLENRARLLGYNTPLATAPDGTGDFQLDLAACAAGEDAQVCTLPVEFYWQGLAEMEQPYQIFLHLVDAEGRITAQQDAAPGERGKEPTTGWLPGEIVSHPVELPLPPDIAPGRYSLHTGMYLPPDGPRLFVLDEAGRPAADFVKVGTVVIRHK